MNASGAIVSLASGIHPSKDVTSLQLFKRRELAIAFRENTISLDKLIGYVELKYFHEIWPDDSRNKSVSGTFFRGYEDLLSLKIHNARNPSRNVI